MWQNLLKDESKIELFGSKRTMYVRRKTGERLNDQNFKLSSWVDYRIRVIFRETALEM